MASLGMASAQPAAGSPSDASAAERDDRQTQLALSMDAHPARGAALYRRHCAECHGARALGDPAHGIPALAGQRFAYVVRQLANFANAERDNALMHDVTARAALQSPQAWTDIGAYLNGRPNTAPLSVGPGSHIALGRGIFGRHCAGCHGADAGGDADGFVPSLRHQHYVYLDAQMRKLAEGYRHNLDEELKRFLQGFGDHEMSATADFLSRLTGPAKDRRHMRGDGVVVD